MRIICLTAFMISFAALNAVAAPASQAEVSASVATSEVKSDEEMPTARLVVDEPPGAVETETVKTEKSAANEPASLSSAEVAKLPEAQIPVLTGSKDAKKSEGSGLGRLFATLAVLGAVIGGGFYAVKRWGVSRGTAAPGAKIRVLTQHSLGPKKNLAIIQVAGEAILIGITDQNISMIKTLSLIDDEVPENPPNRFDQALDAYQDEFGDGSAVDGSQRPRGKTFEGDDFAMRGLGEIRDTVSTKSARTRRFQL